MVAVSCVHCCPSISLALSSTSSCKWGRRSAVLEDFIMSSTKFIFGWQMSLWSIQLTERFHRNDLMAEVRNQYRHVTQSAMFSEITVNEEPESTMKSTWWSPIQPSRSQCPVPDISSIVYSASQSEHPPLSISVMSLILSSSGVGQCLMSQSPIPVLPVHCYFRWRWNWFNISWWTQPILPAWSDCIDEAVEMRLVQIID